MEEITGYSREEILNIDVCDLYANPGERANVSLETLACSDHYTRELQYRKKNGALITVSATFFPIKNDQGKVTYFDGILEDITERRLAEIKALENETFRQMDVAKNELLANVSHELRTPLASIKGFIETLIEPDVKWSNKKQLEFLNEADREADHLMLLIRDLLDMSRLDSGKLFLNKRDCHIEDLLESTQPRMNMLTAHHYLKLNISSGIPVLNLDPDRIAQVITNLVENAVKFSPEGTQISLEAKTDNNSLIISIEDQGEGIAPEAIDKLFNRFYQVEKATLGKTRGTGLGLAICKGIITAHEGQIWVKSQSGLGSTFSFSIPLPKQA
jgi:PAS domain S-box-containing protein